MILNSHLEVNLYQKESFEPPDFLKDKLFSSIKFVYQPQSIHDIRWIFSYSRKKKLSLIPRGAATTGIGGIAPLRKSIMVDLTHLNRIVDFDEKKKTISFEAGMRWWELKQFLKQYSLDLYTYPTSLFSTVGGWLSTGGYGVNSLKYGHISNFVESIEVVTPDDTKMLDRKDGAFKYFMGTEGQMGIISKVKLKIQEANPSKSYLVFFNNTLQAVCFLSDLFKSSKIAPDHVSYFDRHRLAHKNLLLNGKVVFPKLEGILTVFEDISSEEEFINIVNRNKGILAEDYLTAFLWNERYFPLSIKHFHPSILGCETILPLENLTQYATDTRKFGENYGIEMSTEATFINNKEAVAFTIFPAKPGKSIYFLQLLLTYSLTRIALKCGGKPYGIGIWNLPLLKKRFSNKEINEYRRFKKKLDPFNLVNPAKSLSQDYKITYFLKLAYVLSALFSNGNPVFTSFSKGMNRELENPKNPLSVTDACANCGACTIVCPAFLMSRNETVTAKGKLFLLKKMLNGSSIPQPIAEKVFLCLHCHLCENVCQSKLTLLPIWDQLESMVEKKFGRPREKIDEFIKQVESDPSYTRFLDLMGSSPNNNHRELQDV